MDSPESSTAKVNPEVKDVSPVNASRLSNSPPVQESPFTHFVSTFSPLTLDKIPHAPQPFVVLNSPPLVFTTPRVNPRHKSSLLASEETPSASKRDDKESQEPIVWDKSSIDLRTCFAIDPSGTENEEPVSGNGSSERIDKYLADNVEDNSTCQVRSIDRKLKQLENLLEESPNNVDTVTESLRGDISEPEKKWLTEGRADVFGGGGQDEENDGRRREHFPAQLQDNRKCLDSEFEKVEECKIPSEIPSELKKSDKELEDSNVDPFLNRSNNNSVVESEVNQQRGLSRRCLQFEESQHRKNSNANTSLVMTAFPQHIGASSEGTCLDLSSSSWTRQLINLPSSASNPMQSVSHSKPSGIGVHLNSIIKANNDGNASMKISDGSMSILEIRSKAKVGSSPLEITNDVFNDDLATPSYKRGFVPEAHDSIERLNPTSPKKKKKASGNHDDEGCKRCNCKKTKCLKLYCECFAAGVYCDDSCSCQGCLNKPEHAETVLQTRQLIESRNPLAFAPKIIPQGSEFSVNNAESGILTTPASARHKRGCNCKKSMCLKKYCECFQGGVGCSSGCRCENCKNVFGKKDDYVAEDVLSSRSIGQRSESEIVVAGQSIHHLHKLTPPTPSFQHSDHGKGEPKSQIIIRRYQPPPDSDPRPQRYSDGNDANSESSVEITKTRYPDQFNPNTLPIHVRCSSVSGAVSPSSDTGYFNVVEDEEDGRESQTDASTTPIKQVKVCSPSRKRVSPPQHQWSETGTSSSGPLKSGRRFILKALPPFPPLTPCIENRSKKMPDDDHQPQE